MSSRSRTRSPTPRSPSIPRRRGSPSFLDRRRITSARKRPIPYKRKPPPSPTPSTSSCDDENDDNAPAVSGRSEILTPTIDKNRFEGSQDRSSAGRAKWDTPTPSPKRLENYESDEIIVNSNVDENVNELGDASRDTAAGWEEDMDICDDN